MNRLTAALDRAAGGAVELLMVSGYAGIGKTALIRELYDPAARPAGSSRRQVRPDRPHSRRRAHPGVPRPAPAHPWRERGPARRVADPAGRAARHGRGGAGRGGTRDRDAARTPASAAPAGAERGPESVPSGVTPVPARLGAGAPPAGDLPRRPAMGRHRDARPAGAAARQPGDRTPAADRRVPRQRGGCGPSADSDARRLGGGGRPSERCRWSRSP